MKNKLLFSTLLTLIAITALFYFSFDIHRLVPLSTQWLHPATIAILFCMLLWLLIRLFYHAIKTPTFKSYTISGPLSIVTALTFAITLYLASPMKRAGDMEQFLRNNEAALKQVIEDSTRAERTSQTLTDLNIRLIKGENNSYHFELYTFLGYGYRILYAEHLQTQAPQSPGKSPTLRWHSINGNWYYYSYLD